MESMIKGEKLLYESATDLSRGTLLDCCKGVRFVLIHCWLEQTDSSVRSKWR